MCHQQWMNMSLDMTQSRSVNSEYSIIETLYYNVRCFVDFKIIVYEDIDN